MADFPRLSQAQYFATGKIDKDQVADYAQHKGWSLEEAEHEELHDTRSLFAFAQD